MILVLYNGTRYTVLIYISCQTRVSDGKISCEKGCFLYKIGRKARFSKPFVQELLDYALHLVHEYKNNRRTAILLPNERGSEILGVSPTPTFFTEPHSLQSRPLYRAFESALIQKDGKCRPSVIGGAYGARPPVLMTASQ